MLHAVVVCCFSPVNSKTGETLAVQGDVGDAAFLRVVKSTLALAGKETGSALFDALVPLVGMSEEAARLQVVALETGWDVEEGRLLLL